MGDEGGAAPIRSSKRSLIDWIRILGPGAIIASLTIGTGELIFSARSGVLFGYSILWVFVLILLLKWGMVFSLARHFVVSGVHPIQRWNQLPGPRGWLSMTMLVIGTLLFPVWVGFHSGVIGTLLSQLTGVDSHLAALLTLASVMVIVYAGGYTLLERIQFSIVVLMVLGVIISLVVLQPDWLEMLVSMIVPTRLAYPDWLFSSDSYASISKRPVWIEVGTYVGVIGGSSYDYLAYVAYVREKGWDSAAKSGTDAQRKDAVRVPFVDLTVSFLAVLIISAAFVASGHLVLGPNHRIPNDSNMLNLQAEFLTRLHPWLYPLYIVGAFLTMYGTLYGTIEVAPAVFSEWSRAYRGMVMPWTRFLTVTWCALGGTMVIAGRWFSDVYKTEGASGLSLVDLVTPAAIVTGVLTCGIICLTNVWMDKRFLPRSLRMNISLVVLNFLASTAFFLVGLRSLRDIPWLGVYSWGVLFMIFGIGWMGSRLFPAHSTVETDDSQHRESAISYP
ncbi:Nramp family divalent metal transporter [bacterium]|nr:Nramp family divalent metal transporter [bacterium]